MDNRTLIENLSRNLDVSRDTAIKMIESLAQAFGKCGAEMDSISLPSFGVFEPRKRQERIAVHPASGKRLLVPPRISMAFKMSPLLKQRINDGK